MNVKDVRSQLPHGAIKEIAQMTNLSTSTVSQVLNGKSKSTQKSEILKATAEYLAEWKAKNDEASKALSEAIGENFD